MSQRPGGASSDLCPGLEEGEDSGLHKSPLARPISGLNGHRELHVIELRFLRISLDSFFFLDNLSMKGQRPPPRLNQVNQPECLCVEDV